MLSASPSPSPSPSPILPSNRPPIPPSNRPPIQGDIIARSRAAVGEEFVKTQMPLLTRKMHLISDIRYIDEYQTQQRVAKAAILEETLASFNVAAKVINITHGPTVTRYELKPGDGVKISKITSLIKDISLMLAAPNIRIEAPIPGKALIGIEVPNEDQTKQKLKEALKNDVKLITEEINSLSR